MQIENLYSIYLSATGVTTDTRNIGKGNMFFALKGEKFNANQFAAQAFAQGASYVIVDEITEPSWGKEFGDN
jgi:UDP-N-acetylmuramoyl-tripeptide--D-alanyl-D-alanine ligase